MSASLGADIRQLREKRGLSVEALSAASGVAADVIAGYEGDQQPASLEILERLLDHLRPVTPLYLGELMRLRAAEHRVKPPESVPSPPTGNPRSRWRWVWPTVDTADGVRSATRFGLTAASYCASAELVSIQFGFLRAGVLPTSQLDGWAYVPSLVGASLFALIAWGLHKQSRSAALSGLFLYCAAITFSWGESGPPRNPVLPALIILGFVGGVRGTFARHRSEGGSDAVTIARLQSATGESGEVVIARPPGATPVRMTTAAWLVLAACLAVGALAVLWGR